MSISQFKVSLSHFFILDTQGNKDKEQEEESVRVNSDYSPGRGDSFFIQFARNVLIEKYDSTTVLLGKLFWPLFALILCIIFYPKIGKLADQFSTNLSRTSRINVAGVEIEVYADSLRGSDLEAYSIIGKLNQDDLIRILKIGDSPLQVPLTSFSPEYRKKHETLENYGLLLIDTNAVSIIDDTEIIVELKLTELGLRVYRELQSILINFVTGLPVREE